MEVIKKWEKFNTKPEEPQVAVIIHSQAAA